MFDAACNSCAVVLANADTSHLSDAEAERIDAAVAALGMVTLGGPAPSGFTCIVCGFDAIEGGVEIE